MTIDKHPVSAEYMPPPGNDVVPDVLICDEKFSAQHVRHSQYCLEIVRYELQVKKPTKFIVLSYKQDK